MLDVGDVPAFDMLCEPRATASQRSERDPIHHPDQEMAGSAPLDAPDGVGSGTTRAAGEVMAHWAQ